MQCFVFCVCANFVVLLRANSGVWSFLSVKIHQSRHINCTNKPKSNGNCRICVTVASNAYLKRFSRKKNATRSMAHSPSNCSCCSTLANHHTINYRNCKTKKSKLVKSSPNSNRHFKRRKSKSQSIGYCHADSLALCVHRFYFVQFQEANV